MTHLQDLYDYYLKTKPSKGKVKSATTLLIHVCKAFRKSTPEEITFDLFAEIPQAIDDHYKTEQYKALLDKSILAEMIGRYGPRDGWEKTFEILLEDRDENLRQFTLHALEFAGENYLDCVIPYLEKYRSSSDLLMKHISAHIVSILLCSSQAELMKATMFRWTDTGDKSFIEDVARSLKHDLHNCMRTVGHDEHKNALDWLCNEFKVCEN